MVKRLPYVQQKGASFYVRLVVPPALRPFVEDGKGEILRALGNSQREVKANHARALASAQDELDTARARKVQAEGVELARTSRRYSRKTPEEIARSHYQERLAFDEELRGDHRYARREINVDLANELKEAVAGKATNKQLAELIGRSLEQYRERGNHDAPAGSDEWRQLGRAIALAELEAMRRAVERDEGDFSGQSALPMLQDIDPEPAATITFDEIIDEEVKRRTSGKDAKGVRPHTIKQFRRAAASFAEHRKSDNATTVTQAEGEAWIAHLLNEGKLSNKTIGMTLVDLRTVLNWGRKRRKDAFPPVNPLKEIEKPAVREVPTYERTFTIAEAKTILLAARQEKTETLRLVPWITAYTGARVSEVANLRPEDFFQLGDDWFLTITTSGSRTTKNFSSIRRVPVHPDLIAQGLIEHVQDTPGGQRLFIKSAQPRISEWMHRKGLITREHMAPNHSWRHLFEDLCTLAGVPDDARAYVTGRSTRSSRERYGRSEAMLPGLAREIAKIPSILSMHT